MVVYILYTEMYNVMEGCWVWQPHSIRPRDGIEVSLLWGGTISKVMVNINYVRIPHLCCGTGQWGNNGNFVCIYTNALLMSDM